MRLNGSLVVAMSGLCFAVGEIAGADLVGGGVVSLQAWSNAASAQVGTPVTVYRTYLAFDGPGDWNGIGGSSGNILLNVFNANIFTASTLYQNPLGGDVPSHVPGIWDSWVTIGADLNTTGTLFGDPSFQWTASGLTNNSGWYNSMPPNNLGAAIEDLQFGTGLYLVLMSQWLLEQRSTGNVIDIRSDGSFGSGGAFSGEFGVTVGRGTPSQPQFSTNMRFADIPAPGTGAVAALAGVAIRRRRRA